MAKFAETYPEEQIVQEVLAQLTWYLLCKSKNNLVAEYSLKDMSKPIGVSEYQITGNLPEGLAEQLPSVEDIQKRIKN